MSSLKSVKKTGIRKISILISPIKASAVGSISISEIRGNEKTTVRKYDLFDKDVLTNDAKDVKSFKKTRKSTLGSKARRKLEALDEASDNSRQNGLNTYENKMTEKTDPRNRRISRNSILPEKSKSVSATCCLSDAKSLLLKDTTIGNEVKPSNSKSSKRHSYVSKKKKVSSLVCEKDLDLEEHKMMKTNPLKRRISRSSTLPGKLKNISTTCSQSGGKSLILKDTLVENEVNHSNSKSSKRQSYVSKKKNVSNLVYENDSNLVEHKMMKADPLKRRVSRSSTLPGKLKSISTTYSQNDGKTLILKDTIEENEVNRSNSKSSKRQSYVLKKKKVSNFVYENDLDLEEHKMMKADPLKRRISRTSILPGKLKSASCSLSNGKYLVFKDITLESKLNLSKIESSKRQSYVLKEKKKSNIVHGENLESKEHKMIKCAHNMDVAMEEIDKENHEFESEPVKYGNSKITKMLEAERGKRDTKQVNVKSPVVNRVPIDFNLEPADILRSKYKILYSDYDRQKNHEQVLNSTGREQENMTPKRKKDKPARKSLRISRFEKEKFYGNPTRRSVRIAAMEKNKLQIA